MEKKPNSTQKSRILYLVIVGVLVVAAVVIGLTAAFGRKSKTPVPDDGKKTEDQSKTDDGNRDTGKSDPVSEEPKATVYLAPATGAVSKGHDLVAPVYSVTMDDWRVHQGIDVATAAGAEVYATAAGTVKVIWTDPLMGECLSIDHGNGVVSVYKNLSPTMADGIKTGAAVKAGQVLGTVGDSALIECADAPHLHFEMECNGESVDPLTYISDESYQTSLSEDTAFES